MTLVRLAEQFIQDLRYALRTMARQPLFTLMAGLSLALGIGANTAIYSFIDAILMRALPVQDPESLMVVKWHSKAHPAVARMFSGNTYQDSKTGYTSPNFPYPAFELLRDNNTVFSSMFAFNNGGRLNVQVHGQADLADCQYVSGTFFNTLGVPPAAGRLIDNTDDQVGAAPVAVLSFGYAQRRFGEASKALGQSILIYDTLFTVAGVAPAEFFGVNPDRAQDVYLPLHASLLLDKVFTNDQNKYVERNFYWAQMMGRLRPGVTQQ